MCTVALRSSIYRHPPGEESWLYPPQGAAIAKMSPEHLTSSCKKECRAEQKTQTVTSLWQTNIISKLKKCKSGSFLYFNFLWAIYRTIPSSGLSWLEISQWCQSTKNDENYWISRNHQKIFAPKKVQSVPTSSEIFSYHKIRKKSWKFAKKWGSPFNLTSFLEKIFVRIWELL